MAIMILLKCFADFVYWLKHVILKLIKLPKNRNKRKITTHSCTRILNRSSLQVLKFLFLQEYTDQKNDDFVKGNRESNYMCCKQK